MKPSIVFYVSPSAACAAHQCDAPVVAIKAFERGFYPIYSRLQPCELNDGKFSNEECEAAIIGSMFGWNVPGAKAAVKAIERIEEELARA